MRSGRNVVGYSRSRYFLRQPFGKVVFPNWADEDHKADQGHREQHRLKDSFDLSVFALMLCYADILCFRPFKPLDLHRNQPTVMTIASLSPSMPCCE